LHNVTTSKQTTSLSCTGFTLLWATSCIVPYTIHYPVFTSQQFLRNFLQLPTMSFKGRYEDPYHFLPPIIPDHVFLNCPRRPIP
jgi:hypothetical protein